MFTSINERYRRFRAVQSLTKSRLMTLKRNKVPQPSFYPLLRWTKLLATMELEHLWLQVRYFRPRSRRGSSLIRWRKVVLTSPKVSSLSAHQRESFPEDRGLTWKLILLPVTIAALYSPQATSPAKSNGSTTPTTRCAEPWPSLTCFQATLDSGFRAFHVP